MTANYKTPHATTYVCPMPDTKAAIWNPPETAPRDMSSFLANIGMPWPVLAVWNQVQGQFCTTELQLDMYEGVYNDTYFQCEYYSPDQVLGWMPLPELPEKAS